MQSQTYQEPIGSILHADGGHGKTLLCRAIIKQMPSYTTIVEGYEKLLFLHFMLRFHLQHQSNPVKYATQGTREI